MNQVGNEMMTTKAYFAAMFLPARTKKATP